ncbi:MAG: M23 family metallopeptidase [Thermoanaerobaculia bacterium]
MARRVVPALVFLLVAGAAPLSADTACEAEGAGPSSRASAPPPAPCPARDPEDGRCYPSADAADLAWLSRASRHAASDVEDENEEERLEAAETPESSKKPGFWQSLGDRIRSLVVRRSDSRPVAIPEEEIAALFSTTFPIPVSAYDPAHLRDTFLSKRGKGKKHHAIDLGAPRGTPVFAVADGVIERLGRDRRGGKVVYLRDTTGRYTFYYAHLRLHAKGLKAGDHVVKGQRLGEVGATGRVIGGPHLHFAIYRSEEPANSRLFAVNPYLIFATILPR